MLQLISAVQGGGCPGDSEAALHLHCRNFHRCSPNQVLLLAGTGLRGAAGLV